MICHHKRKASPSTIRNRARTRWKTSYFLKTALFPNFFQRCKFPWLCLDLEETYFSWLFRKIRQPCGEYKFTWFTVLCTVCEMKCVITQRSTRSSSYWTDISISIKCLEGTNETEYIMSLAARAKEIQHRAWKLQYYNKVNSTSEWQCCLQNFLVVYTAEWALWLGGWPLGSLQSLVEGFVVICLRESFHLLGKFDPPCVLHAIIHYLMM